MSCATVSCRWPIKCCTVEVESAIVEIRGERVILDADLAALYGVETKRLNEQVKRNADRFGDKYAFQLTKKEFDTLKSQSATSKSGRRGRRYPPRAFTEYGVVMAATVLDSDKAVQASRFVVDVFVEVKRRVARGTKTGLVPIQPAAGGISALERLSDLGPPATSAAISDRWHRRKNPSQKKQALSALRKFFNLAVERHICIINPAAVAETVIPRHFRSAR